MAMNSCNGSVQNDTSCLDTTDRIPSDEEIFIQIQEFIKPEVYQLIFLVLFVILFFLGTVGNFLVCYSVWRSHSLKNVTNYFLVNLAFADFFVTLICLPATVSVDILRSWFFGLVMCKLFVYLQVSLRSL